MNFPHALFLSAKLFYKVCENEEKLVTWLENVQADGYVSLSNGSKTAIRQIANILSNDCANLIFSQALFGWLFDVPALVYGHCWSCFPIAEFF